MGVMLEYVQPSVSMVAEFKARFFTCENCGVQICSSDYGIQDEAQIMQLFLNHDKKPTSTKPPDIPDIDPIPNIPDKPPFPMPHQKTDSPNPAGCYAKLDHAQFGGQCALADRDSCTDYCEWKSVGEQGKCIGSSFLPSELCTEILCPYELGCTRIP